MITPFRKPHRGADDEVGKDGNAEHGRALAVHEQGHGHAAEAGDGAAGNIDTARDDDEGLRDGQNADDGALLRQVLQVVGAEEVLGQERGQQEQRDDDQADGELRVLGQPHKRIGLFILGKRGHNYLSS